MKKLRFFLALMMIIVMMTSCGGQSAGPSASDDSGKKILNVGRMTELFDMDSSIATEADCLEVISAIVEPLYVNDANGVPAPALAQSYEVSDDGKTWTFHIRENANWTNGEPVTADDFVFAWRRLADPATASEYSFMAEVAAIKNASPIIAGELDKEELGVSAKDEKTLVVELDHQVPYFLNLMTFPSFCPINQAFCEAKGDQYALGADNLLFCGPFIMSSWEVGGNTYSLTKNPDYWNADAVKLDEINFQIIKDVQQTMLAYENGQLDYVRLAGDLISKYQDTPGFTRIEEGYLWYLSPNINPKSDEFKTGLQNLNLRKAIALSYDKNAICEEILKDGSIPADFAIPYKLAVGPDGKDFRETASTYLATDKEKAKEYWEQAKKELGVNEVTIELLFDDSEATPLIAQYLQSEIESNLPGVHIQLKSQPKKSRMDLMQKRNYQLGLSRWGPDYADPLTYLDMWTTGYTYNYGEWSNAEYDSIIEKARVGDYPDASTRWEALKKAEQIVMDEAVIFPVFQKGSAVMLRPGVTGMTFFPVGVGTIYTNVDIEK